MKRTGNLMPRILHSDNLREAFLLASKGKKSKHSVIDFRDHLEERLESISLRLADGTYDFSRYHRFTIFDPKKRVICAAPFETRVVLHALMNVCEPIFERYQLYDSYACRKGKGLYKALGRAQLFCRKYRWFVKLDVRKFFDTINHEVLLSSVCRLFKDKVLLAHFQSIIASYHVADGCGLPMGNLTSQFFANHYMAIADHYAKERVGICDMVRYMDDILLFDDDKEALLVKARQYISFVSEVLKLDFHPILLNQTCSGVPFCGYVVYGYKLRLNERSKRRFCRKLKILDEAWMSGLLDEQECVERTQAIYSFVDKADAVAYKKKRIHSYIEGSNRVLRGGSWNNNATNCRVANRNNNSPSNTNNNNGLRLSL